MTEVISHEVTQARIKQPWQYARPVLYATMMATEGSDGLLDPDYFVSKVTGVSSSEVHRARVIGSSSLVGELVVQDNLHLRVNPESDSAGNAAAAAEFSTRDGAILPRATLLELVQAQLDIDEAQRSLDAQIRQLRQPS